MNLSPSGRSLLVTALVLVVVARLFGTLELYLLAGMALVAVAVAALATAVRRPRLSVERRVEPTRVRVGMPARIELTVANEGSRSTPVLLAHDRIGGDEDRSLNLAPIRRRATTTVSYGLPTSRRGPLELGPLELTHGDALGLASARITAAPRSEVLVLPGLVDLAPLRAGAGTVTGSDRQAVRSLAPSGEDFFALRPYVLGDELRRVHWRNSARTDDLVVRQTERARQGHVVVVLDVRRDGYDDAGFERAVSVAASALHAAWAGGDAVRFLATNGGDSGPITQRLQLDAIEERLARLAPTPAASVVRTVEDVARAATGGSLVVVTGHLVSDTVGVAARARRTFGAVVVVTCQAHEDPPAGVVVHDGVADLPTQWLHHLHHQRSLAAARRVAAR